MNFFKSHHVNKLVRNKGKRQTLLAQWVKNPKGGTIYLYPNFFSFEIIYEWSSSEASEKKIQNIRFQEEVLIFLHYFSISRASTVHYWGH